MQRKTVVLPHPDGPKSPVTPVAGTVKAASRSNVPSLPLKATLIDLVRFICRPCDAFLDEDHRENDDKRKHGHAAREDAGFAPTRRLDIVVYRDRRYLRRARDIAADHQNDAELTNGMGEAEHGTGEETGTRQRHGHCPKRPPRRRAQRRSYLERSIAHGLEGVADRLHHERQRIDHGANDQSLESEGESPPAPQTGDRTSDPFGTKRNQEIEAEHGRRQDQGHGESKPLWRFVMALHAAPCHGPWRGIWRMGGSGKATV